MSETWRVRDKAVADCLPLHPLEARILVVLSEGIAHGYRIVQEIERRDSGWTTVFPANLYRRLRALASRGLIEEIPGGEAPRGRRSFQLTKLGRAVARAEAARLADLLEDLASSALVPDRRPR